MTDLFEEITRTICTDDRAHVARLLSPPEPKHVGEPYKPRHMADVDDCGGAA